MSAPVDERTDSELVLLTRSGDQEAFGLLVERYYSVPYSVALRMVPNEETARDLAQDAILQAFLSIDRLRNVERFQSWLYGIVINVCRSYLRGQKADVLSLDTFPDGWDFAAGAADPQEIAEEQERQHQVLSAVQDLSPNQREAVLLFYYRRLSLQEIATTAGISIEAVKVRLYRARGQLRERLLKLFPEIDLAQLPEQRRTTMVRVTIRDIVKVGDQHIILLLDEAGGRILPIWVGAHEALSIAMGLREFSSPRPLTYNFMASLVTALGAELEEARVEALKEDTFYGVAKLRSGASVPELDARPSDVLALAVRTGSPIYVGEEVLASAGIEIGEKSINAALQAGSGMDALLKVFEEELRKTWMAATSPEERERCQAELNEYIFSPAE